MQFEASESRILRRCLEQFAEEIRTAVIEPLREQMRGFEPRKVGEVLQELNLIGQQLAASTPPVEVHEVHGRLLKTVVVAQRRALAEQVDGPRQRTSHREVIRYLELDLRILDGIIAAKWFSQTQPARLPRLTDFLSVRYAEEAVHGEPPALAPRVYDEKFHILEAPTLFLPDLAHYRRRCEIRQSPVTVAFVDIDDFKSYNTRYGETRVDRDILPGFMELVESHVFAHGHAYRFGGDEYVLLLPNMERDWSLDFVARFQDRLAGLNSLMIDGPPPTVSVGLFHVAPDCFLTDREVQERANWAKNHAKAAGKDRVAYYGGELLRKEDLELAPARSAAG